MAASDSMPSVGMETSLALLTINSALSSTKLESVILSAGNQGMCARQQCKVGLHDMAVRCSCLSLKSSPSEKGCNAPHRSHFSGEGAGKVLQLREKGKR